MQTSRYALILLLALSLLMAAAAVQAYPTISGDTGLVLMPTAEVMPFTHFDIAIDYAQFSSETGNGAAILPIRLVYGIANGVELSGNLTPKADNGFDSVGVNGKVLLANEDLRTHLPALAVGARYLRMQGDLDQEIVNADAVASTSLFTMGDEITGGYKIRGHLGIEYTRFDRAGVITNFTAPMAGLSYEGFSGTSFVVDYLPALKDHGTTFRRSTVSGAMRFQMTDELTIEAGATRPFEQGKFFVFAGINYHYGAKEETPERAPTVLY